MSDFERFCQQFLVKRSIKKRQLFEAVSRVLAFQRSKLRNAQKRSTRAKMGVLRQTPRHVVMLLSLLLSGVLLSGCVSYQFFRGVEGREVVSSFDVLEVGKASLGEVLLVLGAPDKVLELKGKDLLLYERVMVQERRLTLGVPVAEVLGASIDLSAYGTVTRYDTLACFFTPDGILQDMVFEKGSSHPYLRTLLAEE